MSRWTEVRWVASVVAVEAMRDYSDTALMSVRSKTRQCFVPIAWD